MKTMEYLYRTIPVSYTHLIENKIKKSLNVSINVLSNNICDKYDGKDYLSSYFSKSEVIENAENYILRVILLARCKYLISSITSATLFMLSFENCMFQKSYFFDLGKYCLLYTSIFSSIRFMQFLKRNNENKEVKSNSYDGIVDFLNEHVDN